MKKILALILALTMLFALAACGEGDKPTSPSDTSKPSTDKPSTDTPSTDKPADPAFSADLTEFYNKMMAAAGEAPMMMDLAADKDMLEMTYAGLKDIEVKQLVAVAPMMSAVAVEFVFVEVSDAADVDKVKTILQARIDAQVAGGAWYPETIEQWKNNSEIVVIDNYVCLFVTSDKDILVDAFRNGTEVGEWAKAPIYLSDFHDELYNELYPVDSDGNRTGPYVEDLSWHGNEQIETFFPGLTSVESNQLHIFMPMMSAVAYEVVLIEVVNEADVKTVKDILQGRVDTQVSNQYNYPMVIEGWQNSARIVSNGNFIMMAVGSDCDIFVERFNDLF